MLLRQEIGDVLRDARRQQGRTLREVSSVARVSLGYLSEVERGQKEASSELLASICGALDVPLSLVLREVSERVAATEDPELLPAEAPAEAVLVGAPRGAAAPADAVRTDAVLADAVLAEAVRADAVRGDAVRAEAVRGDAVLRDVILADGTVVEGEPRLPEGPALERTILGETLAERLHRVRRGLVSAA